MSDNQNNNSTPVQPPVYFMPPQQQNNDLFSGFGGILCSILAGLVLGQFGIGLPRIPKL